MGKYTKEKKKIVLWGAGGFAIAAMKLYGIESDQLSFIVDSDPKKWGLSFLDADLEIVGVDVFEKDQIDLVVIASMYAEGICKQIQAMKFFSDILTIYPSVKYLNAEASVEG